MTIAELNEEIRKARFTPSAAAWEDETVIHAFSVEGVNHPEFEASFNKRTGWLCVGKKHTKIK